MFVRSTNTGNKRTAGADAPAVFLFGKSVTDDIAGAVTCGDDRILSGLGNIQDRPASVLPDPGFGTFCLDLKKFLHAVLAASAGVDRLG